MKLGYVVQKMGGALAKTGRNPKIHHVIEFYHLIHCELTSKEYLSFIFFFAKFWSEN